MVTLKLNDAMESHLEKLKALKVENAIFLRYPEISWLIFPEFIEWDGCVLLRQEEVIQLPERFKPNPYCPDKTSYEADFNHVHIGDYIEEINRQPYERLRLGLKILNVWQLQLKKQFPSKEFILILSFDGEDCTLRFHTFREDVLPWINVKALNDFKEGIIFLKV